MLPCDLPSCRVLTFSYPASVAAIFGKTASDTILQHATTLVQELAADRRVSEFLVDLDERGALTDTQQLENAMERPIVFICHSLGGIIVKRVRHLNSGPELLLITDLR